MKFKSLKNLLLAFLAVVAIVQFANQRVTMDRIGREQQEQLKVLEEIKEENLRLQEEVQNLNSSEYIEKQARERLQMVRPDEIPVINDPDAAALPEADTRPDNTTTSTSP